MFLLKIVTPKEVFVSQEVKTAIFRGVEGDFAALENMTDLIAILSCSSGYFLVDNEMTAFSISGGVFTMFDGVAVVVCTYAKFENFDKQQVIESNNKLTKLSNAEIVEYFRK